MQALTWIISEVFILQKKSKCWVLPTVAAVKVIRVVWIILEDKWLFIYDGVTLLANILAKATSSLTDVAWTAQMSVKCIYNSYYDSILNWSLVHILKLQNGFQYSINNVMLSIYLEMCWLEYSIWCSHCNHLQPLNHSSI